MSVSVCVPRGRCSARMPATIASASLSRCQPRPDLADGLPRPLLGNLLRRRDSDPTPGVQRRRGSPSPAASRASRRVRRRPRRPCPQRPFETLAAIISFTGVDRFRRADRSREPASTSARDRQGAAAGPVYSCVICTSMPGWSCEPSKERRHRLARLEVDGAVFGLHNHVGANLPSSG